MRCLLLRSNVSVCVCVYRNPKCLLLPSIVVVVAAVAGNDNVVVHMICIPPPPPLVCLSISKVPGLNWMDGWMALPRARVRSNIIAAEYRAKQKFAFSLFWEKIKVRFTELCSAHFSFALLYTLRFCGRDIQYSSPGHTHAHNAETPVDKDERMEYIAKGV